MKIRILRICSIGLIALSPMLQSCIMPPGGFQKSEPEMTQKQCGKSPVSSRYRPTKKDIVPSSARVPFGSGKMVYAPGAIRPSDVSTADIDRVTRSYYSGWKARYLKSACGADRYQITTSAGENNLTVSEAQGYGMILFALMAGFDPAATEYFDGMFHFFTEHPSSYHANLMAWSQNVCCQDDRGQDSAADGDIDIAYSLLLADRQWGSDGAINYLEEAKKVIAAIRDKDVSPKADYVFLGDWAKTGDPGYYDSTRSSDFILAEFRSFGAATGDKDWLKLVSSLQRISLQIQRDYSPVSGLLPDFVSTPVSTPKPAKGGFLESPNDGAYYYNSCRVPWRLGTDFLVSGDTHSRALVTRMNRWIIKASGGKPSNIASGYTLKGAPLAGSGYETMSFIAPFAVSAMVHEENQQWLNALWAHIVRTGPEEYYADTIKLMVMLVVSGNWWSPEKIPTVSKDTAL